MVILCYFNLFNTLNFNFTIDCRRCSFYFKIISSSNKINNVYRNANAVCNCVNQITVIIIKLNCRFCQTVHFCSIVICWGNSSALCFLIVSSWSIFVNCCYVNWVRNNRTSYISNRWRLNVVSCVITAKGDICEFNTYIIDCFTCFWNISRFIFCVSRYLNVISNTVKVLYFASTDCVCYCLTLTKSCFTVIYLICSTYWRSCR